MFKKTLIALSAVAGLGLATAGFAHPPQCDEDKSWQHCRDAQATYLQSLNPDNDDLFHRTADGHFSHNHADSRFYTSAAGDRYYLNPADERYYLIGTDNRFSSPSAADGRYYRTANGSYYRSSDGRYYRTNFENLNSSSTKCVYFDQSVGRYYQRNCQ